MKKLLRLISVATMLLAATTFMACSSDDDDGPSESSSATRVGSGAFVGVVLDNTGKPVEGATVTLGTKTATTNKGGEFKLEGVAVNDPVVRSIQTTVGTGTTSTVTNGDEKLEPKDSTSTSTSRNYAYTLTVTKDGYIPGTVDSMYVSEAEDIGGIEDARLSALKNQYAGILNAYASAVGTGSITGSSSGDGYFLTGNAPEDKSATMTSVAAALKEIQNLYAHLGKTYSSTFVACKTLVPLNASLSGKLKLNPSPATAEVFSETTYPAPKDTVVKVTYKSADGNAPYTFDSKTDAEGNFKFEKLPSGVDLSIEVEGFTAKAGEVEAYFSTDVGLSTYRSNAAELLNNGSYNDSTAASAATIKIDGNSLNVAGVDIMLFAQLEKIWVKETNLIKNNSAALISVKTPLEFTFNKAIQRVDIAGSGFQDVKDENYVVTIDSTDAKKVTITPKDGIWTPKAAGNNATDAKAGEVRLSVLAADGTKELLNDTFTAYFDTVIYVEISDSSKNDVELGLTQPVKLTFSKPMTTASVEAYSVYTANTKTKLTNAFSKSWNEGKTELTLTPTTFWDTVSDADGKVVFTVEGLAQDLTDDVKYWKNNVETQTTGTGTAAVTKNVGLIAYFDNKIDVTVAKVDDKSFTLTFSKAIKALTKDDITSAVTVSYAATKAGLASGTVVSDYEAKFNDTNTVLTISAKNNDFAHTGYYRVNLTDAVVGKTGETKFRVAGTTNVLTTKNFDTDFTVGPEKFAETAVEFVTELPEGVVASRAVYQDAASYLKITFNENIKRAKLRVNDVVVTNYISGKSLYLPLHGIADDGKVVLSVAAEDDEVISVTGSKWAKVKYDATTPVKFDTGYVVSKNTYKMVATSLYAETVSIAGQNDAKVVKIKPTESVTFTFDQDVTGATAWTAELYDEETVAVRNLNETLYKVTATAAGKVVTVSLAEGSKLLDYGKDYYLSLKAVKGTGNDVVVLYDSNAFDKTSTKCYAYLPGSTSETYGQKIIATKTKNYIHIVTEAKDAKYENIYVVKAGGNSKTTDFADFAKSNTSPIVLEFNKPVAGFNAALVIDSYTAPETFAEIDKTKTFASTATVTGNVITITPTYGFPSKTTVVPVVYRDDGKKFTLNCESSGTSATAFLNTTSKYVSREITDANRDAVITELAANVALKKIVDLAIVNGADKTETTDPTNPVDNGAKIEFTFTPEYNFDMSDASYTLLRKKSGNGAKWEEIGTTGTPVATTNALKVYVDYKRHEGNYNYEARQLLGAKAYFTETDGTKSFNYGDISYVLVGKLDNSLVVSNTVVAEDKWCTFTYTAESTGVTGTALTQEVKLGTIKSTDVIKASTVTISPAKDSSGTTITGTDAYTPYAVQKSSTEVEIYAKVNSKPAAGHKFEVYVKDNHGNQSKSQTATIQ